MKTDVVYSYGKEYSRKNVLSEIIPIVFISTLFAALIWGICKLDLIYGILLFVLLFFLLCYCILPGAFDKYWDINQQGLSFVSIENKDKRKMIFNALFKNDGGKLKRIDKKDISKIKIVYKKNTISGPAKRTPDTFFFTVYTKNRKRNFDLSNVPGDKVSQIIETLTTLSSDIEDDNNVVYAITHNLDLYDYIYSN